MSKQPQSFKQSFWELARFTILALAIVIPIRVLIAEPFVVSGSSMIPTFEDGNYLIIDKISYELNDPKRDDIAVFRYPNDPAKFFIKRVIGLPNETVDIKGSVVTIINEKYPLGFTLDEPYVKNISNNTMHVKLKDDEYFVMGDNRSGSSDSRYWGAVKKEFFTGRVFLRLLPINNISILPGQYKQELKTQ
ncbi:signal peptidase I [Candidatus Nomurabacteria bacterium RIFCSPHIGHO2_01_FULL_37_25]|uniref:Signal peptidase I n=1 Tax=Candidatus Nomurabacteria bacterium RIFCSPLOWO2_01_FULL_36_16 TaxID=1801767 RepID=A0A1F6WXS9_9BACT|nr:MAG: signal peptidase I [Candidatus Nomurabacteria bacterium RIFCSPHIGHO2_01_FULL_37_25]OGI74966.1 MAG: signal peptidase I [Candidatus Nomurabacteria bacterium RIFCSPHIGHO2_02_FULL_36_29]OGI86678.1 MAG: signal peptidase I [Candidatus Nomurabacteria bacterium RIFCSPLOWO2_01_FULL_36_16]OGI94738.1 MAG: signal peptidase I [Candidatus Nomurabacteria bacterium RIFCSPLOWO2_02_FULL_36_8]